jgi:hypothetical protein
VDYNRIRVLDTGTVWQRSAVDASIEEPAFHVRPGVAGQLHRRCGAP